MPEKTRKARIGKAMVRNNIAAANTMLLMCHPPQANYSVKREAESPKEASLTDQKKPPSPEDVKTVLPSCDNISCKQCTLSEVAPQIERLQEAQPLKTEEKEATEAAFEAAAVEENQGENEPCQKTVAENVKVKNMKRKIETDKEAELAYLPQKKLKVDKPKTVNSSYKDLIKKNTNCVKVCCFL